MRQSAGRWLFAGGILLAVLLVLIVVLTPLVAREEASTDGWGRLLTIFARDKALRQTCLASAAGLVASDLLTLLPSALVR